MNIREDSTIRAPSGKDDICAKFTIDTVDEPFVLHDIAQVGQEYTLSFWAYSETDGEITAGNVDMPTSSSWTRYVVTFIADSVDVPIYFNIAGTYHIYNAQLEIGCKDTDFALNPADLEEDVEDLAVIVNNHTTQFTVMDGKIAGLIEENTTIRSEYDTLVDRTADLELTVSDFTVELESTKTTISDNYISLQEYTNTQIAAMESEISLSVANTYSTKEELETVDGKVTTLEEWQVEASQQITKEGIIATVGNYYAYQTDLEGVEDRVEAAESQIIQHADEISLMVREEDVTGDYLIGKINLTSSAASIDASHINLTGYVTISSLAAEGETDINGANITTGLISADRIDVDDLFSKSITATNLHITGNSTFDGVLNGATGSFSGNITTESITATGGKIGFLSIYDDSLEGDNLYLYAGDSLNGGNIYATGSSDFPGWEARYMATGMAVQKSGGTTWGAFRVTDEDDPRVELYFGYNDSYTLNINGKTGSITSGSTVYGKNSIELYGDTPFIDFHADNSLLDYTSRIIEYGSESDPHLMLRSTRTTITGYGYGLTVGEGFTSGNAAILPTTDSTTQPNANADGIVFLAASKSRFKQVFAVSGTVSTSDERDKNIIGEIDQRYLDLFMDLKPILYTWKDFDTDQIHMGLGAQTVEATALEHGITLPELAAVCHDYWDTPNDDGRIDRYSMNYAELSVLTIPIVQSHEWTIAEHTEHFVTVDNRLESLQDQIDYLKEVNADLRTELAEAKEEIEQLKQQASAA